MIIPKQSVGRLIMWISIVGSAGIFVALQADPAFLESLSSAFSASVAGNQKSWCPLNDDDNDGDLNEVDNCPQVSNASQGDLDKDGIGDHCDTDADDDGCPNYVSEHFSLPGGCYRTVRKWTIRPGEDQNPSKKSRDIDRDGIPDDCDGVIKAPDDVDGDGIPKAEDNCPNANNPKQEDFDNDGKGDACDRCRDNNDIDSDGMPAGADNCPDISNHYDKKDTDGDGKGDVCDDDQDGDGCYNPVQQSVPLPDGAPCVKLVTRPSGAPIYSGKDEDRRPRQKSKDPDGDGRGQDCDVCDALDRDGDTRPDDEDNCIFVPNPDQKDFDKDGIGDLCDDDADNDGCMNTTPGFEQVPNEDCVRPTGKREGNPEDDRRPTSITGDRDGDEKDNYCDKCDSRDFDGDGKFNAYFNAKGILTANLDNCPFVRNADQKDLDKDGIGNVCDDDADNDGFPNPTIKPKGTIDECTTWNGSWAQWHKDALSLSGNDRFPGDATRH